MADTLTTLQAMCAQGALYLITPHHLCDEARPISAKMSAEQQAACETWAKGSGYSLYDPRHFERRQVTRIEGPDEKGMVRGYAEDGSFTAGTPAAVLKRLMETALSGG